MNYFISFMLLTIIINQFVIQLKLMDIADDMREERKNYKQWLRAINFTLDNIKKK